MIDSFQSGSLPSILLFGDSASGKETILKGLVGDGKSDTICFDTKYYTASAKLVVADNESTHPDPEAPWEAIILAFNISRESSFRHAQAWASLHCPQDAEVKVCTGNNTGGQQLNSSVEEAEWLTSAREWLIQEQFEYIQVGPSNSEKEVKPTDEGAQGLKRLKEALEAHMWPGLIMKGPTGTGLGGATAMTSEIERQTESPELSKAEPREALVAAEDGKGGNSDEELQKEMESFEALISGVASARQKIGSLPDKERRQEAEALTMRLLSSLGIEEESQSDSDLDST